MLLKTKLQTLELLLLFTARIIYVQTLNRQVNRRGLKHHTWSNMSL